MKNLDLYNKPINIKKLNFNLYKKIRINTEANLYNEGLVNLYNYGIKNINAYYSKNTPPYFKRMPYSYKYNFVRKTVANKLFKINKILNSYGLELYIYDGYRNLDLQKYFYYNWIPNYLKEKNPDLDEKTITKMVSNYWAKPLSVINEKSLYIPPHVTGGAIDLTIRYKNNKQLLEMGGIFDDISKISNIDYYENINNNSFTYIEAKKNRRLLYNIMISEGFAPHPKEWWHWSYGDQMWANYYGLEAMYGFMVLNLN